MNIFRRFFGPGGKEIEGLSRIDESISSVKLEAGSSSMHQPEPGASRPQRSQRGRTNNSNGAIEILTSDDEGNDFSIDDSERKEIDAVTSSITKLPHAGMSKKMEGSITVSALCGKPAASPVDSTKSPSVTTTDTSNQYDDDCEEGKENTATSSRTDGTSKESPLDSTEVRSKIASDNSKLYSARKRRRKRGNDSHTVLPTGLLSPSSSKANHTAIRQHVKKKKNLPEDLPNPTIRIVREKNFPTHSLTASKDIHEGNPFDFPSETKLNTEDQGRQHGSRRNNKLNINDPQSNESGVSKSGMGDNSTESMTPPTKRYKSEQNLEEESIPDNIKQKVDSPGKAIPQLKLPPELAPFNNPGVCDYGVIRTSRLRNRKKTANAQEDVLYQNIQGQRRCKATKDGQRMTEFSNTNRCLNCAEGVFKYCHTHRDLDESQRAFWERRNRRDEQLHASKLQVVKTTKPNNAATNRKNAPDSQMKHFETKILKGIQFSVDDDQSSCEENNPNRCVIMLKGKGRCGRACLTAQPGFCYHHAKYAEELKTKRDEFFRRQPGTMRCTAVSKVGSKCKFKAVDGCVFCSKHINLPPERVVPIVFLEDKNVESIRETEIQERKTSKISKETAELAMKRNRLKPTSDSSIAGSDAVPKNIEFPREMKLELATSFDDRCFNVYRSKQCSYKHAIGEILCQQCLICRDEGKPFDHILDAPRKKDSISLSNKCLNYEGGKQCQNTALEGKVLCMECIQSWDLSKKSSSEHSQQSGIVESKIMESDDCSSDTYSSGSDDSSEDSRVSDDTNYDAYCMAYSHKEFFKMWKNWEKKTEKVDEVEDSRLIKRANNTMSPTDTDGQVKAQYGRVLPHAMKKIVKILELRSNDVFLDIGHGVGNTCLHASFCTGCDSRGIEVVSDRHEIANKFRGGMYAEHNSADPPRPAVGNVNLRLGRLEDPQQKEFLTNGVTRAYVNNFNGVFAERSSKNKDKWFLDDYISGIFASMAPGAIMVTFHPLNLGLDRESANSLRSKHNLDVSDHASYYDSEKILLGQAFCSVKWNKRSGNTNNIYVYKYRRLQQPGHNDAVFLCCNPSCKLATDMVPIPATTMNEDGRCVINHCQCKFSPKNLRKRKQTSP